MLFDMPTDNGQVLYVDTDNVACATCSVPSQSNPKVAVTIWFSGGKELNIPLVKKEVYDEFIKTLRDKKG